MQAIPEMVDRQVSVKLVSVTSPNDAGRRARSCRPSFREMTERRAPNFPDDLERSGKKMTFIPVDDHMTLKDATMTVELYHVIANSHLADGLIAYIPEHKMMIEADIATAAEELQGEGKLHGRMPGAG